MGHITEWPLVQFLMLPLNWYPSWAFLQSFRTAHKCETQVAHTLCLLTYIHPHAFPLTSIYLISSLALYRTLFSNPCHLILYSSYIFLGSHSLHIKWTKRSNVSRNACWEDGPNDCNSDQCIITIIGYFHLTVTFWVNPYINQNQYLSSSVMWL